MTRPDDTPRMRVEYAFMCDAATEHGGKLNALGIGVDHIGVTGLPATHPRLALVARLVFEDAAGSAVPFRVEMVDADGQHVVAPVDGLFHVEAAPGRRLDGASLLVELVNITFTTIGPHEVRLSSNGAAVATLPLEVWHVPAV